MKEIRVGLEWYIIYKKVGATITEPCGTPRLFEDKKKIQYISLLVQKLQSKFKFVCNNPEPYTLPGTAHQIDDDAKDEFVKGFIIITQKKAAEKMLIAIVTIIKVRFWPS